jgi:hypothetical protein
MENCIKNCEAKKRGEILITIIPAEKVLTDLANTNLKNGSFLNGLIEVQ